MIIRAMEKSDYDFVVSVLDRWWGGPSGQRAHPVFFYELGADALVVEDDGQLIGFLLGFMSRTVPQVGYIHLVGIHPDHRRRGVGNRLYEEFTKRCRAASALRLKAIAAVGNEGSVRFHEALGFVCEEKADYAGPGRARMTFIKDL